VTLTSDRTSAQIGDVVTYTLRVTSTGRETIGEYSLVMHPPPNLAPVSAACGPVAGQPDLPSPDGLRCEYGYGDELAPGASVTMTLAARLLPARLSCRVTCGLNMPGDDAELSVVPAVAGS
jgi:uncharacterized repeat protein (TIGR01451 family)